MKRTTKRAVSLLLALCMILALAGCGKKKTGTDAPAPSAGQLPPNAQHNHTGARRIGTHAGAGHAGAGGECGPRGHEVGL